MSRSVIPKKAERRRETEGCASCRFRGIARGEAIFATVSIVVGLLIGATAVTVYRNHLRKPHRSALPARVTYSLEGYLTVPEERVICEPVWQINIPGKEVRRVAVFGQTAWITKDQELLPVHLSAEGAQPGSPVQLSFVPGCIAVGREPGEETQAAQGGSLPRVRFFIGSGSRVFVVSDSGEVLGEWNFFGSKAIITDIAVAGEEVFVADAGNRVVHRVDWHGEKIAEIGHRDAERGILGFIIPSPYFDLAWGADGFLRVVNSGVHRVELYTADGDLEVFWGRPGLDEAGFCGCCNPAHVALLSDHRLVTAEKGIPRVKLYSPQGELLGWVAPPERFAPSGKLEETRDEERLPVLDVEVFSPLAGESSDQWVLILDPGRRVLEAFRPRQVTEGSGELSSAASPEL